MASLFSTLASVLAFLGALISSKPPNTPAGIQFSKWLDAFNTADRATLLAYHAANFPYDVASHDVADISSELGLSIQTGGFEFKKAVNETDDYGFKAIMKEVKRPQFASVEIRVDTEPPHRVLQFDIGPIRTPDEFITPEERKARLVDNTKRSAIVMDLAEKLEEHYISKPVASKMAAVLRQNLKNGTYDSISDAVDFASALSRDIHAVYHDRHMHVLFLWPRPSGKQPSEAEMLEMLRLIGFGFGATRNHSHGIASIEIKGFVSPRMAEVRQAIAERMGAVANASALIVDLRRNGGGDPDTVALVASYLFGEEKVHLNDIYDPRTGETKEFWTDPSVSGTKFGVSKPLYILTSNRTASGGEELSYDLQALRRGTLVGETTIGMANLGALYKLQHEFDAIIPDKYPINPVTGKNWEAVGVVPDVQVPADDAFAEAYRRAKGDLGFGGMSDDPQEGEGRGEGFGPSDEGRDSDGNKYGSDEL